MQNVMYMICSGPNGMYVADVHPVAEMSEIIMFEELFASSVSKAMLNKILFYDKADAERRLDERQEPYENARDRAERMLERLE